MKSIASKLLLSIGIAMILFFAFLFYQTYSLTNKRVRAVVRQQVAMALKFDIAIRHYVGDHIRPLMYELIGRDEFIRETMSTSYVAGSIFNDVRQEFTDYILKFSSDNPRNPANLAGPEELKVLKYLNSKPDISTWQGELDIDGQPYMALFSARRMKESCLHCHGKPEDAPASLIEEYGPVAGFHRPIGMVIGSDTVAIPMAKIQEQLYSESRPTFLISGLSLLLFGIAIVIITRLVVTDRIATISKHFSNTAQKEDYSAIELLEIKGRDEISDMATSFNTLSRKLRSYYSILDQQVKERTRELADKNRELQLEIEDRKQAEISLRESEATLKSILLAAPTGIGMVCDRVFTQANERLCRTLGYTRDELIGKSTRMVYPTDADYDYVGQVKYEQIAQQNTGTVETRWCRKDGKIIDILLSSTPLDPDDLSRGVTFTALEITERKLAEITRRENENLLRKITENIPNSYIALIERDHSIGLISGQELKKNDLDPQKLVGLPFEQVITENTALVKRNIQKALQGEEQSFELSSGERHRLYHIIPLKSENGSIPRVLAVIEDISHRRQLESHLRQAQKMEAIGTLAGGIAHDFNNILFPLMGFADLLKDDLSADSPLQKHVDEILRASLRAKELVKQILAFSRMGDQNIKPIKLQSLVNETLKLLRSSIPTTIDIEQDIDPACGVVLADPTQMHQIVMNLATNAYHAMEDTGGTLTVSLGQVSLAADHAIPPDLPPGEFARLSILDTGTGIDEEIMDKIFDPYFTTKATGKGTGLGLSVVQGIINQCSGDIQINSQPGKGTRIDVFLPIMDRKTEDIKPGPKAAIPGGSEKILLVDDEMVVATIQRQMLERLGYTVKVRTASLEALEAFRSNPQSYDLVISDMTMPNMTGAQLAREIRQIRQDIPIILCTGFSDELTENKQMALNIQGFIMKPVIMKELGKTVRQVLDRA